MRYSIPGAAVAATLLLAIPAFAQVGATSSPASPMDQPAGGVSDSNVAVPTGAAQSSPIGKGNMNGSMRDGMSANAANSNDAMASPLAKPNNTVSSSASGSAGNVIPNGATTSNPAGSGASSEATLNEHGETGTSSVMAH
jgi:hypothetical protein